MRWIAQNREVRIEGICIDQERSEWKGCVGGFIFFLPKKKQLAINSFCGLKKWESKIFWLTLNPEKWRSAHSIDKPRKTKCFFCLLLHVLGEVGFRGREGSCRCGGAKAKLLLLSLVHGGPRRLEPPLSFSIQMRLLFMGFSSAPGACSVSPSALPLALWHLPWIIR